MASTLEKELFNYILQLDEAKKICSRNVEDFFEGRIKEITRVSVDQYNNEIDEAIGRVESGDFYTQDEIEKLSKDW